MLGHEHFARFEARITLAKGSCPKCELSFDGRHLSTRLISFGFKLSQRQVGHFL